jgi:hypothetical protein
VELKKKVNEKSNAKTNNSTHNVKVMCDVRMTMEKWEMTTNRKKRLRKECLKVQKLHTIIETWDGLDLHDSG